MNTLHYEMNTMSVSKHLCIVYRSGNTSFFEYGSKDVYHPTPYQRRKYKQTVISGKRALKSIIKHAQKQIIKKGTN